ncbi:GIY-YIG nuclease family protein [Alkalinema pantanalense CENA528]|uniref:GIY-YIG nuclease family protein n=1 Tax=Alkalinema pantanalense TaxID=1620705 RepID=UPI003D6F7815
MADVPKLAELEFIPYIDTEGQLPDSLQGKVGVYAIFDRDHSLQYIGYSRDVFLSLKQHLVRQVDRCYGLKVYCVEKPSRSLLETVRTDWIAEWMQEKGATPPGNDADLAAWTEPISVSHQMTAEEQEKYNHPGNSEVDRGKVLKTVARRIEANILKTLHDRGIQVELRFNPKLKEEGLLDLK